MFYIFTDAFEILSAHLMFYSLSCNILNVLMYVLNSRDLFKLAGLFEVSFCILS